VLFTQYQGPYEHNFEFNESFGGIYNLWSNGVNFADFDDDGDFELISPGQRMDLMGMTGWWNIYQNLGSADSAWFETPAIFMNAGWVEEYGYYGTFEDLDNDGDYDAIYSYLRLSNEPFANCRINPGQTPWEYSDSLLPENNDIFRFPELSDIDNDGDNDLLVINSLTNELNFYENNGTPEYPEWQYNPNWISGLDVIDRRGRFADLNRDGKCDLTIFTNDGLTLYLNTGSGANPYWERVDGFSDIPTFSSTFDFVDYNGDGKQDIAFASGGKVVFYRNDTIVDVDEEYTKPKETSLRMSNFPNPFNSSTTIRFNIPNQSKVSIEIYDILGRKVDTVCKGLFVSGNHKVIWEAEDFSSGIYFYRLSTNEESAASKMILIK
ncbi:MAG: T9SS type A sorting domain-containing protein, partial [candidate division Zixibacteria bacterium]|nr:T9SS type A sorting domain-containing protein [candidate division Zixibacteria bacterium]